jgi:UDP-N-acetyl-D-glucosamine dehydrogenase
LVATDHDDIDYRLIAVASKLVIDTRNVFARRGIKDPRIFKA